MERRDRCIICPKCQVSTRVRDTHHFKRHGIKIVSWRCHRCDKLVRHDRSSDLRDHIHRIHPGSDPEDILPVWEEVDPISPVPRRGRSPTRKVSSHHSPEAKPQQEPEIELLGEDNLSFLASGSSSVSTPTTQMPKSYVRRVRVLSPLTDTSGSKEVKGSSRPRSSHPKTSHHDGKRPRTEETEVPPPRRATSATAPQAPAKRPAKSSPRTRSSPPAHAATASAPTASAASAAPRAPAKRRARSSPRAHSSPPARAATASASTASADPASMVIPKEHLVELLSAIPEEEWGDIKRQVMARRGEESPSKASQTRLLERASAPPLPGPSGKETRDTETQTARPASSVYRSQDGLVISFPDGSTLDLHSPVFNEPLAPPPSE